VVSFGEQGEKQIPFSIISQATSCSLWKVAQYCMVDCSELTWVYSKKDTGCITGKWWPNSVLIKTCVPFTTVSIILSIPCIFRILDSDGPGVYSQYTYSLQAGRSGDGVLMRDRFSAPAQTCPGAHTASCTVGTGCLSQG
jgi:hypothetical protein